MAAERSQSDWGSAIPEELRRLPQWVTWRTELRGDKTTKIPYDAKSGRRARASDPRTWTSFSSAVAALEAGKSQGIGFVFSSDDPYTGVDLDNALASDLKLKPWAEEILRRFPAGSYCEVSPSRRGLHIIVRARKPDKLCKKPVDDGAVEIYDHDRYFTVTGNLLGEPTSTIPDGQEAVTNLYQKLFQIPRGSRSVPQTHTTSDITDDALLAQAFSSRNGHRIKSLYEGDFTAYRSRSEADLALCSYLWFWTHGDEHRVDTLFRKSGLMRDKWLRGDYRSSTMAKAADGNSIRSSSSGTKKAPSAPSVTRCTSTAAISHSPSDLQLNPAGEPTRLNTHWANAWRLARKFGGELRFVEGLGFIVYDGRRWVPSKNQAMGLAAQVSRIICAEAAALSQEAARTVNEENRASLTKRAELLNAWARASEQGSAIRESLQLAASLVGLNSRELDAHPFLLNVENGTIDLRTGRLNPHSPDDFLTKIAPVRYDPEVKAPLWIQFVSDITNGEEMLATYLQKALGYSITGSVQEQCMFFAYGTGQNGKTTLLDTLRHILGGGYVCKAAPDLLLMSKVDRQHPSEIADLRGARIAVSQEVSDGRKFDAQKLKELTGERWLKTRQMYGDWFDFEVTFKIWLAANHQPSTTDTTHAFWRRIHLVPFTRMIEKPIRDLDIRLAEERSGILNWLLEGARLYFREGVERPSQTLQALQEYRVASDSLGQFINECCVTGQSLCVKANELWIAYEAFTQARGLSRIRKGDLKMELLNRGFSQPPRRADGYFYNGLALRVDEVGRKEGESS